MDTYWGKLIIDNDYIIKVADEKFFSMVGEGNYISFFNSVCTEDYEKVKLSVDTAFKTQEVQMCCYRSRTYNGDFPWLLCKISYLETDRLSIEFIVTEEIYSHIQSCTDLAKEYNTYLDLTGGMWIKYDLSESTITICTGGFNRVTMFSGTLDELISKVEALEFVHKDSLPNFHNAIYDLRNGTQHFEYTIKAKSLSKDEHYSNHSMKCKTIAYSNNHKCVFGIVDLFDSAENGTQKVTINNSLDAMTELLNKKAITTYARERIASMPAQCIHIGIIDLDNFKYVNDIHGHMVGDEVIITAAGIIKEAVGGKGHAGRIGGDEMMIVLEDVNDLAELRAILRTIRTNIEYVYKNWDKDINVTCSMGVASYPEHGTDYETLFEIADKMLYLAKKKGKNRYIIFTPEIHSQYLENDAAECPTVPVLPNEAKEELILKLIENLLHKPIIPNIEAIAEIGKVFALDEISMFIGKLDMPENYWQIKHSMHFNENINANFLKNPNLSDRLKKSPVLVVDHVEDIENIYPEMFKYFKERNINSAVIINASKPRTQAYMMLYKMTVQSRKWTEQDLAYFKFIGKIFSLKP